MKNIDAWSRGALVLVVLAATPGCKKKVDAALDTSGGDAAAAMVAATAEADSADTTAALAPPQALVAADPAIPLNEAVVGATHLPADYFASTAPPQPVVEDQPTSPDPADTWVSGYWWWSRPLSRYVWVSGAWRRPPPDQYWTAGSWSPVGGRYVWAPGYWGHRGYTREMIDTAPPAYQSETQPPMPGVGYAWTPGYYGYRENRYSWIGGSWARPPSPGVMWVEPRYVNTGGRYYMQPGRWDFPAEHRGVVYHPDIDVRPGARIVLRPVPEAVVSVHENFVSSSARVVARGGVPAPNGGFVMPHARVEEHGRAVGNVDEHARGGAVVDEHARGGVAVDEHARGGAVVDEHARGGAEVRGGVNVQEHPEQRGGAATEVRGGVARPEVHAEAHGGAAVNARPDTMERGRAPEAHPNPTATTQAHPNERKR